MKSSKVKIILGIIAVLIVMILSVGWFVTWNVWLEFARERSNSMAETINENDIIIGRRAPEEIKRGDIIIFQFPKDLSVKYVKRVIGLPGEEIEIKNQSVYVNGRELQEKRVYTRANGQTEQSTKSDQQLKEEWERAESRYIVQIEEPKEDEISTPIKIPQNHYFVMGDNRSRSLDSRQWGTVARDLISSKVFVIYSDANKQWVSLEE